MKINFWKAMNVSATLFAASMTVGYLWKIASMREKGCGHAEGDSVLEHMARSIECESILGYLSLMVRAPKSLTAVVAFDALYLVMMCFAVCPDSNQATSSCNIKGVSF